MPHHRASQSSLLSYAVIAGAVFLAAAALDRRMNLRSREEDYTPDETDEESRNPIAKTDVPWHSSRHAVAFSDKGVAAAGDTGVRPAGQGAMRDPEGQWDDVDEYSDESFPASDPPGKY